MRVLIALVLLCALNPARADVRRMCESISTNTEAFVDERKKGYTKNQMKDNARQIANQRQLDKTGILVRRNRLDFQKSESSIRFG